MVNWHAEVAFVVSPDHKDMLALLPPAEIGTASQGSKSSSRIKLPFVLDAVSVDLIWRQLPLGDSLIGC